MLLIKLSNTKDLQSESFHNHQFFNRDITNAININVLVILFVYFQVCFINIFYRIFSNKRPFSFKRPSLIKTQYNPKNIL